MTMNLLPSDEERQWLTDALRTLIARRGVQLLDEAPLVEPTNAWFPEKWSTTAAHGHRLAQRLLYYAGLGSLRPTLSAFVAQVSEDGSIPWDAGTAGWFAGIEDSRVHFGLHVRQFSDPEAAAGVLAHEVAHAWRSHHKLVIDDRDNEELLTDVTTIVLGFGILTTNNTDRYRTSGTWSVSAWSQSSAGYLPPQAMAYLLALWCSARGKRDEPRIIERHLEPNQRSYFRAAMDDIADGAKPIRERLTPSAPSGPLGVVRPESFTPYEPNADEIEEPVRQTAVDRDATRTVYRTPKGSLGSHLYAGITAGFVVGLLFGFIAFGEESMTTVLSCAAAGTIAFGAFMFRHAQRHVCSHCKTPLPKDIAVCPKCAGRIDRFVTERQLRDIRIDEFDRRATRDTDYEDCDECEPEQPCAKHVATERIGPAEPEPEPDDEVFAQRAPAGPPGAFRKILSVAALLAIVATVAFAWWRQHHVVVYLDNALHRPLTISIDGETVPFADRLLRRMSPGAHRIVLRDGATVLESFEATVRKPSLYDALLAPRFFVYSADSAGIYERARYVYSTNPLERDTRSDLIALQRWFEQEDADYVFTDIPASIHSSKATRTSFDVAHNVDFRRLAYAWYRANRTEDAARALQKGLQWKPCDPELWNDLLYVVEGPRAIEESRVWVARCDDSVPAHRAHQNLLNRGASKAPLFAAYRERLAKHPTAANHYLYGRLMMGTKAIDEFREALKLDPQLQWARVALGHQLLIEERDQEAYDVLATALHAEAVPSSAPSVFAMAAIATNHIDDALKIFNEVTTLDALDAWSARWMLVRAKGDWDQAKVLLVEREQGEPTPQTTVLRARLDCESGASTRASVIADLAKEPATAEAARVLALEDAFENDRLAEAAGMKELPEISLVYAAEAGLLTHAPAQITLTDPFSGELIAAASGAIDEATLLADADDADARPHAWFALAVRAATVGDAKKAARYFRKSAVRALDREFPYRAALRLAERYELVGR